jgi:hypothetical protein
MLQEAGDVTSHRERSHHLEEDRVTKLIVDRTRCLFFADERRLLQKTFSVFLEKTLNAPKIVAFSMLSLHVAIMQHHFYPRCFAAARSTESSHAPC